MLIGGDDSFSVQSRKKHILNHIVPEMFDDVLHQNIIKAANKLAKDEFPITLDYFLAKARKTKTLILIEMAARLQELNDKFITNTNCDYYLKLLQEIFFDEQFSKNSTYEEFNCRVTLLSLPALRVRVKHAQCSTSSKKWKKEGVKFFCSVWR